MSGYIDLHCHYLPGLDDGVRSTNEGIELCLALARAGYELIVATPHIRTAMYENRKPKLEEAYDAFCDAIRAVDAAPRTGLGAEHFCDDVFWNLFSQGEIVPYPGGKAALIELPSQLMPMYVENRFFQMNVRGVRPVLAHPERYTYAFKHTKPLERMVEMGVLFLLDLMSLTGKYGKLPQKAAIRMLDEDVYFAACSDCHKPGDVPVVEQAIQILEQRVGRAKALQLLSEHPSRILEGRFDS